MNTKLVASCLIAAATLLSPLASRAEGKDGEGKQAMTFVKDSVITTKIKTKLAAEKMSSLAHISVDTTSKGEVVLSGKAKTQADIDKAVAIARGTEDVKAVTNNIRISKDD